MGDFNPVSSVTTLKTVSRTEKRKVLWENAAELLKMS